MAHYDEFREYGKPAWPPTDSRIEVIGQNGNNGEHYTEDLGYMYTDEEAPKQELPPLTDPYRKVMPSVSVDVYDILQAYEVTNPAVQHAIKKMLCAGKRGYKGDIKDIKEAISSLERAVELEEYTRYKDE